MFALTITTLVIGLAAGVYLAIRFLPPLASTREGVVAEWTVRILIGCATGWAASTIYEAVHAYVYLHGNTLTPALSNDDTTEILRSTVQNILLVDSLLIGFAGAIYLLAPLAAPSAETSGN